MEIRREGRVLAGHGLDPVERISQVQLQMQREVSCRGGCQIMDFARNGSLQIGSGMASAAGLVTGYYRLKNVAVYLS